MLFKLMNISVKNLLYKNNSKCLRRNYSSLNQEEFIRSLTLKSLREKLTQNLKRWPNIYLNLKSKSATKHAAVLVPLCEVAGEVSLLYTLRSSKLKSHTRQVSFPGGIKDDTDANYESCAIRETFEEVGIIGNDIETWGVGKLLKSTAGDTIIMPVIGSIPNYEKLTLNINPDEVDKVFTVPLSALVKNELRGHTQFRSGYSVPIYFGGEERIWGMTAIITHIFLTLICPPYTYDQKIRYLSRYGGRM